MTADDTGSSCDYSLTYVLKYYRESTGTWHGVATAVEHGFDQGWVYIDVTTDPTSPKLVFDSA